MTEIFEGLYSIFLQFEVVGRHETELAVLIFAIGCGLVGAAAVFLDLMLYFIRGHSLLALDHGRKTILILLCWSIGALIVGWFGQMINIFLVSVSACVLVGFGWPVIFTKIIKKVGEQTSNEPEQT